MTKIHWSGETQLMGFGESDTSGAWVKFQLMPEDLEKFRGLKGQCFNVVMEQVETADTPEEEPRKGGEWSKKAGMLCGDPQFQQYAAKALDYKHPGLTHNVSDISAKDFIYEYCDITTRVDLDYNTQALNKYKDLYCAFMEYGRHGGFDEGATHETI